MKKVLLVIAVALLVAAGAGVWWLDAEGEKFFFAPTKDFYGTPGEEGVVFEEVQFRSVGGGKLKGWFLPAVGGARGAKGTVVHLHGNAGNMGRHRQFVEWLPARGFNVLMFDYRGYGESAGVPSVRGVLEDSWVALDYARGRADVDGGKLLVFGQSLGAVNAIVAAGCGDQLGIRAVAAEAPFFSYGMIASERVPLSGWFLRRADEFSVKKHAGEVSPVPLLLIHGTADRVVDFGHAGKVFAAAREPKRLVVVPEGGHIDSMIGAKKEFYRDLLVQFFEEALGEKAEGRRQN